MSEQIMAFHLTSHALALDPTSGTLTAQCRARNGIYKPATLDLDAYVGNRNGSFQWGGVKYSRSARRVRLDGSQLKAELCDTRGAWHAATLELGERVVNVDGALKVVGEQKKHKGPVGSRGDARRVGQPDREAEGEEEEDFISALFGSFFPEPRRARRPAGNVRVPQQQPQQEGGVAKEDERKSVGDGAALAAAQLATQNASESAAQKSPVNAAATTPKDVSKEDKKLLAYQARKLLLSGEYEVIGEPEVSVLGLKNKQTGEMEMTFKIESVPFTVKSHVQDKEKRPAPVSGGAGENVKENVDEKKGIPAVDDQAERKDVVKEDGANEVKETKKSQPAKVEDVPEQEDDIDSEWEMT